MRRALRNVNDQGEIVTIGSSDASFEEFVRRSADQLFTVALLLKGSFAEAEELLSDALERAYRRWHRIARTGKPELAVWKMLVKETITPRRRLFRRRNTRASTLMRANAASVDVSPAA